MEWTGKVGSSKSESGYCRISVTAEVDGTAAAPVTGADKYQHFQK